MTKGTEVSDCSTVSGFQHTELRQRTTGTAAGEVQARAMERPRMVSLAIRTRSARTAAMPPPLMTGSRNGADPKETGRPLSHGTWCAMPWNQTRSRGKSGAVGRVGTCTGVHRIGSDRAAISC